MQLCLRMQNDFCDDAPWTWTCDSFEARKLKLAKINKKHKGNNDEETTRQKA